MTTHLTGTYKCDNIKENLRNYIDNYQSTYSGPRKKGTILQMPFSWKQTFSFQIIWLKYVP